MKRPLVCATLALAASVWGMSAQAQDPDCELTGDVICPFDPTSPGATVNPQGFIGVYQPGAATNNPLVVILPLNPIYPVDPITPFLPPNPIITNPGLRR